MSNKETLQNHNERLDKNNIDLNNLFNKVNNLPDKVTVENHYLEGQNVVIVFSDGSKLFVDISSYIGGGLTEQQIEAINNMNITIENDELIIDYDETILGFDFILQNNNLIVDNTINGTDFNINESKELEVLY